MAVPIKWESEGPNNVRSRWGAVIRNAMFSSFAISTRPCLADIGERVRNTLHAKRTDQAKKQRVYGGHILSPRWPPDGILYENWRSAIVRIATSRAWKEKKPFKNNCPRRNELSTCDGGGGGVGGTWEQQDVA